MSFWELIIANPNGGQWAVPDEVFRGSEAQYFDGPYLFNKYQCHMVSP